MQTYPVFLKLTGQRVVFSGAGDHAAAKIRLLLKTQAHILVVGENPSADVREWAGQGRLQLHERAIEPADVAGARLVYGANDDPAMDERAVTLGREAGALANIVDDFAGSDFLTPAMVDRDPVVVAIGTEGAAPVLARKIKAEVEALLPASTGLLARIADGFRPVAARLRDAAARRKFWHRFFFADGPRALAKGGEAQVKATLAQLYDEARAQREDGAATAHVDFVGAGPGDPELLTLKARKRLHEADIVLHDALVTPETLELARREAQLVCVGKKGFGPGWTQEEVTARLIEALDAGHRVVRLKSGDPGVFGRLDEEVDAVEAAGHSYDIVPGITAASAAAASMGASLTRRGRNSELRILTAHDTRGFAEQDWKTLARPGETAAIYMGVKASRFLAGRLLMHGADPAGPVTIVEKASRPDQRTISATLGELAGLAEREGLEGPAIIFLGLASRKAAIAALAAAREA